MENLLLLHGALGSKEQWGFLADRLADKYEVHVMDLPGHGKRASEEHSFSIPLFAEDVIKFLEKKHISSTHIFGYSMGGYIGVWLALHYPDKIGSVITLATKFAWNKESAASEARMLDAETILKKIPAFAKQLIARHGESNWRGLLQRTGLLMEGLGNRNAIQEDDYARLARPVLLMSGDRDKMISPDETISVFRQIPDAQLAILPGTPHPLEQAGPELLGLLIRKFLHSRS
jgi:pimeloyl-ACP methyl ester carboxylesterase